MKNDANDAKRNKCNRIMLKKYMNEKMNRLMYEKNEAKCDICHDVIKEKSNDHERKKNMTKKMKLKKSFNSLKRSLMFFVSRCQQ